MDLDVMNVDDEVLYKMNRKEADGLKIVEFKENGCDYFDLYELFPEKDDFELLVETCRSAYTGTIHVSPYDWLCLKTETSNSFGFGHADGSTVKSCHRYFH